MKKFIAILMAKIAGFFTRILKRGGGTALPGLIAEKLDPNILTKLTSKLKYGTVIITGTNGKTTTSKMLNDILRSSGMDVIANQSGSNLNRGIISTLLLRSNLFGTKIKGDIGIFEIDEATMPKAVSLLKPKFVTVTNIFRDQLDRYGEVDKTAQIIGNSLKLMPKESYVLLNADDPMVASLSSYNSNTAFFGIEDSSLKTDSKLAIDSKDCLQCGAELNFEYRYFGHLGKYKCSKCKFKRPTPQNTVYETKLFPEKTIITMHTAKKENVEVSLNIPGIYNVYNALAATSMATGLGISGENIKTGLEAFTAAFGRMEKIKIKDKFVFLLLVKNPTGYNETLRSIVSGKEKNNFLLALNDNFADGTDISWIWDVNLNLIKDKMKSAICTGTRAEEMALRLKYSDLNMRKVSINKDLNKALNEGLKNTPSGKTLYVLPTYTAMMEIRNNLVKGGYVEPFWKAPGS